MAPVLVAARSFGGGSLEKCLGNSLAVYPTDKASHFVDFAIVAKELANAYDRFGFSRRASILMGFGASTLAGLVIKIGDGTTYYGFSYEDLVVDVLGAGTAAAISAARLDDLTASAVAFFSLPPGMRPAARCRERAGTTRTRSRPRISRLQGWPAGSISLWDHSGTYSSRSPTARRAIRAASLNCASARSASRSV
jgi:hypothetical protein